MAFTPTKTKYQSWVNTFMNHSCRWDNSRDALAAYLRDIRKHDSNKEAKIFSNWLTWIGIYPIKFDGIYDLDGYND